MTGFDRPRFREISLDEAHLRQAIPAALCGRRVGDLVLRARFPFAEAQGRGWFRAAPDLAFRIRRLDGKATPIDPADGPAAAMLLDDADPLLCEIEAALGLTLTPGELIERPAEDWLIVTVEGARPDEARADSLVDLAVTPAIALLPAPPVLASGLVRHVPVPVRLAIAGPRLPPQEAAALAPGDLLLIGPEPLAATLHGPGETTIPGRLLARDLLFRPDLPS